MDLGCVDTAEVSAAQLMSIILDTHVERIKQNRLSSIINLIVEKLWHTGTRTHHAALTPLTL